MIAKSKLQLFLFSSPDLFSLTVDSKLGVLQCFQGCSSPIREDEFFVRLFTHVWSRGYAGGTLF